MTSLVAAPISASGRIALRAGPLSLDFDGGALRFIRFGGREVLRAIYVAVRDSAWGTVEGTIEGLTVEARADRFTARFRSLHREGPIAFDWEGIIEGDEHGTVRFEMEGEAHATFLKNRLGICVLHPIDECAGQACEVERADGEVVRGVFPRFVSPQQPFLGMRAVRHEVGPGLTAELRFQGDIFEMEDQRNWSDASYKTYSTPLALPYPAEVAAGTRIKQSVTLRLQGDRRPRPALVKEGGPVHLGVDPARSRALPRLGLGASTEGEPPTEAERARLLDLPLDHLRVDLRPTSRDAGPALARAAALARALEVPLEIALFLSEDADGDLQEVVALARGLHLRVAVWLLFREGTLTTSDGLVEKARRYLVTIDREARFGGGTDANFAELNRARPSAAELDQVSFSLNPQVHARDDLTLVENLASLGWIAESARAFVGSCPLALSPVTLRARTKGPSRGPADPRHVQPFGAAWTAGLLAAAIEAGFASLTLFEPTGPRGLVAGDAVHPLFHVLRGYGEMRGGWGPPCRSDNPRRAQALALRKGADLRVLVFSLTDAPTRVFVAGVPLGAELSSLEGTRLARGPLPRTSDGYRLDLGPHELVRLDVSEPGWRA